LLSMKTIESALFLVQSPLHVSNAIEAIETFSIVKTAFFVVTSKRNQKWQRMMIAGIPSSSHILYSLRDDFDIEACTKDYTQHLPWLKAQSFDGVFFADARLYIFVDIINSLQHPNTYLMDDGVASLQMVSTINQHNLFFDIPQSSKMDRRIEIELIKKRFGLHGLEHCPYHLFTAFDCQQSEHYQVFHNPMSRLVHKHSNCDDNQCMIIGQPLLTHQNMKFESYLAQIAQIKVFYQDKRLFYFPHPRESEQEVNTLCHLLNIECIRSDISIEKYLIQMEHKPKHLCGFYSAALWYVSKFQSNIDVVSFRLARHSYNFPADRLMNGSSHFTKLEVIDMVYDTFKLIMPVVDLN
jgi:hypothetical protein